MTISSNVAEFHKRSLKFAVSVGAFANPGKEAVTAVTSNFQKDIFLDSPKHGREKCGKR